MKHWIFQTWVRYGHSCYKVTSREQTHEDAMMEYYCQGPLLTVENRCLFLQGQQCFDWLVMTTSSSHVSPLVPAGLSRPSSIVYWVKVGLTVARTIGWAWWRQRTAKSTAGWPASLTCLSPSPTGTNTSQVHLYFYADRKLANSHSQHTFLLLIPVFFHKMFFFIPVFSQYWWLRRHVRWSSFRSLGGEKLHFF